jgi:hypothetical protein
VGSGGITRVFPDLSDDLLLNLFHKGAKAQWTSRDLDWGAKTGLTSRQKLALARLLTPVYFGEQTAMAGAGSILPQVMAAGETTAQLYLASFIMDEARHFETLTRLYRSLGHDPLGLREIPELLRYHHRIRQGDRADWVWGILFSDVIAKHFYRAFGVNQTPGDPLFGGLSTRILQDESRHLAFAEHYLRRNVATMEPARRRALIDMRDDLFRILRAMTERVRGDAAAFEIDSDEYLGWVWSDVETFGTRIGLQDRPPGPPPPNDPAARAAMPPPMDEDNPSGNTRGHSERTAESAELKIGRWASQRVGESGDSARMRWELSPITESGELAGRRRELSSTAGSGELARKRRAAWWGGESGDLATTSAEPSHDVEASVPAEAVARCFGCLLTLICGRRLAPA